MNKLYSNKQELFLEIINENNNLFTIKFLVDNLIIENQLLDSIIRGTVYHPDKIKYPINSKLRIFIHHCQEEALKYKTRIEFQKGSAIYRRAWINGWLDIVCSHMESRGHTIEKCKIEALKYDTRNKFKLNSPIYYYYAYRHEWLDEICTHMNWEGKIFKSKEECKNIALNYERKTDFILCDYNTYMTSYRNGWLEYVCNHMNGNQNHSLENCKIIALKYKNIVDFYRKEPNVYSAAYKRGWLKDVCLHMEKPIAFNYPRLIYCYEFSDNSVYVGLTKNVKVRMQLRKFDVKDAVNIYIEKTGLIPKFIELTDFVDAKEAQKLEQYFVDKFRAEGKNILNRNKCGGLGGG